jgi:hypothetical protein
VKQHESVHTGQQPELYNNLPSEMVICDSVFLLRYTFSVLFSNIFRFSAQPFSIKSLLNRREEVSLPALWQELPAPPWAVGPPEEVSAQNTFCWPWYIVRSITASIVAKAIGVALGCRPTQGSVLYSS